MVRIPSTTTLGVSVCFPVTAKGDFEQEGNETFTVTVSVVNNLDHILGGDTITVTILDGETRLD